MLRKANTLFGYTLRATDDEIGQAHDFYFDADEWEIRYLAVDVGSWLFGRRVLIAPDALGTPNWDQQVLPVNLTRQQVKDSPEVDLVMPITRGYETQLYGYYGWPAYWGGASAMMYGAPMTMAPLAGASATPVPDEVTTMMQNAEASHVHSMRDLTRYAIEATDGGIGQAVDCLVDDTDWTIRYLVVDTGNWLPGKQVLVAPDWIDRVDWNGSRIYVKMTQAQIKHSPEYDSSALPDQQYEQSLHDHYGYRAR